MRPIDANTLKAEFTGNFNGGYYTVAEIKALIDTAPTVGGWVSVKDRLPPDDNTKVLTYGNPVTHWMPLPEPPKEEEEDA